MYHGDIRLGDTIDIKFDTVSTVGAPTTLAGSPVISAYPGNSTTELTAGITLSVDFDGRTGMHNIRIVATSGNGYATATNYTLVVTTGTVGGTSVVGYCVGSFSIENRSALMPATVARTLVVDAAGLADATAVKVGPTAAGTAQTARDLGASVLLSSGTGTGQLDVTSGVVKANLAQILGTALTETAGQLAAAFKKFFNIAAPAATMDHGILIDTVTTYTGNTLQTGDSFARIGATGSGLTTLATASALAIVQADTDDIQTRLPAALTAGGNMKADALLLNGATPNNLAATAIVSAGAITTSAGKVSGVILADTVTTYTGNTPQTGDVYPLVDTEVAAIKAKTDNLPASPAATGDAMSLTTGERTSIADAVLKRDWTAVTGEAARSMLNALRFLRNKWSVAGVTLTITKEDDVTSAWTSALTTDATAAPVTSSDPA